MARTPRSVAQLDDPESTRIASGGIDRRTFWLSVAASIVASVFFAIFFQPILNWVSNAIVDTIGLIYRGYFDDVFAQATVNPGDQILTMLFAMLILMPIIITIFLVSRAVRGNRAISQSRPTWRTLRLVSMVLLAVALLITSAGPIISVGINSNFQRALMALGPGITEQERKGLLKDWAMMKSKSDWEKIRDKVEALAAKYDLELPVKRQRSPSSR